MRILYLQQLLVLPQSPGNARCVEFAIQWAAQGHEVHFISSTAGVPPNHPLLLSPPDGLHFHLLPVVYDHQMPFSRRVRSFLQFFRQALQKGKGIGGFDVVLAYSAPLSVGELGRRLARFHGIPFVFEIADVWPDVPIEMGIIPPGPWRSWIYRLTNRIYTAASQITVFSEGMQAQVLRNGVAPGKVQVIHNGVQTQKNPFLERPTREKVTVIYTGTMGKANDLTQLVRLAENAEKAGRTDIEFVIVGRGNDEARVRKLVDQLNLSNLQLLPQVSQEEAVQLQARANIGFSSFAPYPVLEANSATKFFDYLASGLPVLLNYQGWQADYLERYQCGLSAPQGDPEQLLQQLLKMVDNPELRRQMGKNGRLLAEACFDRKQLADKMLQLLLAAKAGA